jgi:hypothetical protein
MSEKSIITFLWAVVAAMWVVLAALSARAEPLTFRNENLRAGAKTVWSL